MLFIEKWSLIARSVFINSKPHTVFLFHLMSLFRPRILGLVLWKPYNTSFHPTVPTQQGYLHKHHHKFQFSNFATCLDQNNAHHHHKQSKSSPTHNEPHLFCQGWMSWSRGLVSFQRARYHLAPGWQWWEDGRSDIRLVACSCIWLPACNWKSLPGILWLKQAMKANKVCRIFSGNWFFSKCSLCLSSPGPLPLSSKDFQWS